MDNSQFLEKYNNLNKNQREAVDTIDGPVMVVAGPGTGKTELLSMRVANILLKSDTRPQNILCLTFTEAGASNMRERLYKTMGEDAYRVGIFTFHAFCNHIIERYSEYFIKSATFTPLTNIIKNEILQNIFKKLEYKNSLASYHPDKGFVYLRDVEQRIKECKNAGYSAEDYEAITNQFLSQSKELDNIFSEISLDRMSIKNIDGYKNLATTLSKEKNIIGAQKIGRELEHAIGKAIEINKTGPVSDWKDKYLQKGIVDGVEKYVFKDTTNIDKIKSFIDIYKEYEKALFDKGYYDYDDMILSVLHELKINETLRLTLEEQYQYILIDEFQDTNDAQMGIVHAITSSPIHGGRPNIMGVGDDDQGIFRFQGAELSNILGFANKDYVDVKTIVLDTNYRSTENILEASRNVIIKAVERLETTEKNITKKLSSGNKELADKNIKDNIKKYKFENSESEFCFVVDKISFDIEHGVDPKEIAIISRNHSELIALIPFLEREKINYNYERKQNVFDEKHIDELITICEYVSANMSDDNSKDYLIPRILSFEFWGIGRIKIFEIVKLIKNNKTDRILWMEAMSEVKGCEKVVEVLKECSVYAASAPLLHFINHFMSISGFKEFYFSDEKLKNSTREYLTFLKSLSTLIKALSEYKSGEVLTVSDMNQFVKVYKDFDIVLTSIYNFTDKENSINLLSAHKSKGLEFEHVYIIGANDKVWTRRGFSNKVPVPVMLLPILVGSKSDEGEDDFIRLLYVAMTRAKHTLIITSSDDSIRYLDGIELSNNEENENLRLVKSFETALFFKDNNFSNDEMRCLSSLVENYKMPVTHLQNFLDVESGGPLYFLQQNLLNFPQPMNASGAYGSAIHSSIEEIIKYKKFNGEALPSLDHIITHFIKELSRARLPTDEHNKSLKRGENLLTNYLSKYASEYKGSDTTELNMINEGVILGIAHITGKIDFLREEEAGYVIRDWKTGSALTDLNIEKGSDQEKFKKWKYRLQLIFYKILIEESTNYKKPIKSLQLEFVEGEEARGEERFILEYSPTVEEVEEVKNILKIVYNMIIGLEFTDVSDIARAHASKGGEVASYKAMSEFLQSLLNKK